MNLNRSLRRSVRRGIAAGALVAVAAPAVSVLAAGSAAASTTCTYTVRGSVVTDDNRLHLTNTFDYRWYGDALSSDTPLAGAKVRVGSSWSGLGVFDNWAEGTLGSDGSFTASKTFTGSFDCNRKRDFRVQVSFEDNELEIGSSPWYTVRKESGAAHEPGAVNFGTIRFESGGLHESGDDDARLAAETWVVVHRAIDWLQAEGVPYTSKITVHNPNRTISSWLPDGYEGSYANPYGTNTAYIDDDDSLYVGTILHEIGHLWAYQHSTGEDCLGAALLSDRSTHDATETPCVAFHEGFAAYFGDMLSYQLEQDDLLSGSADYPSAFTRSMLSDLDLFLSGGDFADIDNLADVQTSEFGWMQVFRVLDQKSIAHQVFGTMDTLQDLNDDGDADYFVGAVDSIGVGVIPTKPGSIGAIGVCSIAPTVDLVDVLTMFGSSMDTSSPTVESLLDRADSRLSDFTSTDADHYQQLINPGSSEEPSDHYC